MDSRCDVIHLSKSYDSDKDVFPFTQDEWAMMLLSIADNWDHFSDAEFGIKDDNID